MERISMGILSGMLLVAGIAFFGKKKLPNNDTSIEKNKASITPGTNESHEQTDTLPIIKETNLLSTIQHIKKWISNNWRGK